MSYHLEAVKVDGTGTGQQEPSYMFFIPYNFGDPVSTSAGGDPGEINQLNMAKFKPLTMYSGGGKTTVLKGYVDVEKFVGDGTAITSTDFDGGVSILGNFTDPTRLVNFKFGYGMMSNAGTTAIANYMTYVLRTTYYCEFFDVSMNGVE